MKAIEKFRSLLRGTKGQGAFTAFVGIVGIILLLYIFTIVISNIQTAVSASSLTTGMTAAQNNITANTIVTMNLASLYPLIAVAGLMIAAFLGFMYVRQ